MILPLLLLAAGAPACVAPQSDRILAADLAAAAPAFAGIAPETFLGYAPVPGVERSFTAEELERVLAAAGGKGGVATGICFAWPMAAVTAEEMERAMQVTLGEAYPGHAARLELVDQSRFAAPVGRLVFAMADLASRPGGSGAAVWKGHVLYGGKRRFDVWARVKVNVPHERIVAAQPLRQNQLVQAEHVRVEAADGLPSAGEVSRMEDVVGRMSRRAVAAGLPLRTEMLDQPWAVNRGDVVRVEVHHGAARIEAEGKAETAGRLGDTIPVRNAGSGKVFRAVIAAPGKVTVH